MPPLRRPAVLAVVLAVSLFTLLARRYGGQSTPGRIDARVQSLVRPSDPLQALLRAFVDLGDPVPVIALASGLAVLALALGQRRLAVLAVLGPGLTGTATTLLKPAVGRTLEGDFAYPSGHTGAATALGLVAALLVVGVLGPGTGAGTGAAVLAAGALLGGGGMAGALVIRDEHYPTDTVGGFCVGVVVVLAGALFVDRCAERWSFRRPGPRSGA
ncbi:phosphatase PAP2 family protein [Pseudonocardia sp. T1-2H]|uniref:phosphatase PAP2 family protein n=1 Tax=Pseudonocardia sp. T1-2H TaxID=3128899 RepID=UPI00405388E8